MHRRRLTALTLAASVVLAACSAGTGDGLQADGPDSESSSVPSTDAPAPASAQEEPVPGGVEHLFMTAEELAALPDVVASWDGGEITREVFLETYTEYVDQARDYGIEGSEDMDAEEFAKEALHSLIDTQLALDAAFAEGIEVTGEEHAGKAQTIADEMGYESVEQLVETIIDSGTSEQDLVDAITQQVMIEKFLESRIDVTEPTEEDLLTHYEQVMEQIASPGSDDEGGLPEFEAIRDTLYDEVYTERYNETQHLVFAELREAADVTTFL